MKADDSLTRFLGLRAYAIDSNGEATHRGIVFEVTRDRGDLNFTLGVIHGLPLTARSCVDDFGDVVGWDGPDLDWDGNDHTPRMLITFPRIVLVDPLPPWPPVEEAA